MKAQIDGLNQAEANSDDGQSVLRIADGALNEVSNMPVSYTHLDVYKRQIQDTCQYPMNQLKIQASKVYVKGNYVCFIMLGTISNKQEEQLSLIHIS